MNTKNKKPSPDDEVHTIDGIVELNHPAPFWWQAIFYISIVWAMGYMGYYLLGNGKSQHESLMEKLAEIDAQNQSNKIDPEDEKKELFAFFKSAENLKKGSTIFQKNCVSCHGVDGGGVIGPNLTDHYWIHGDGSAMEILKVIREGVAEKGMPPWGGLLKREETLLVTAYVRSLRGKTSTAPKAPQGVAVQSKEEI